MTETPPNPAATPSLPPGQPPSASAGFMTIRRVAIIAAGGFVLAALLLFILAVVLALTTNIEQSGAVIRLIRDLVIIFLALEGVLIILALAVLIVQVAKLVNLLQTELKPILENTQDTLQTAKGTVQFVSQNVTEPIVKISAFLAALRILMSNLLGLRKAVQRRESESPDEQ